MELTEAMIDAGAVAHHLFRVDNHLEPDWDLDPEWSRPKKRVVIAEVPMYGDEADYCRRVSRNVLKAALEVGNALAEVKS